MDPLMLAMLAVVSALAGFATVLMAGGWVVRTFRLIDPSNPAELPVEARFEPPPADPVPAGDRASAAARATHRQVLHGIALHALAAARAAESCNDHHARAVAVGDASAMATTEATATAAGKAAIAAETAMRAAFTSTGDALVDASLAVDQARVAATAAASEAAAAVRGLPDPEAARRRRLLLMLAVLAALCAGFMLVSRW